MSAKRKAAAALDDEDLLEVPSETSSQISFMMGYCRPASGGAELGQGLALCFVHQLYAIPRCNKTLIDTELKQMREGREIRLIHTGAGMAVARAEDYSRGLVRAVDAGEAGAWLQTCSRYLSWLSESNHISASRAELKVQSEGKGCYALTPPLMDEDIDALLARGYLAPRRDLGIVDVYWISHPDVNGVVCSVGTLRQQLTQTISRSRFKELSERELGKRKFADAQIFQREFYLYDLLGLGEIVSVKTPRGERIFRLPKKE